MSVVMGIGSLALFCIALFVAVPVLLALVMLVPITLRLRSESRARHALSTDPQAVELGQPVDDREGFIRAA